MAGLHRDSHLRSIAKGISYRLFGTGATTGLSFLVTGSVKTAMLVGAIEAMFKVLLYWGHERVWARVPWGRAEAASSGGAPLRSSPPAS